MVAYRGRLYVAGGMGEKEDLSSCEVFCPSNNQWTKMKPMNEVNGWCSACLGDSSLLATVFTLLLPVDKPLRMMESERQVTRRGTGEGSPSLGRRSAP